jgi:hypothetical protein
LKPVDLALAARLFDCPIGNALDGKTMIPNDDGDRLQTARPPAFTVITNAINIAPLLAAAPSYALRMPGSQFLAPTLTPCDDKSAEHFQDFYAGNVFVATACLV